MVPVYVVTGFLGAGKTSLLNQFLALRQASGQTASKVALVVNELGAVGIDGSLLPEAMSRQIELPGGCICCTLSENFDQTLLELIGKYSDLEAIIVETTGVAEPLPIVWSCEKESLAKSIRLAAVITLVDAENLLASFAASPAVESQIVSADVLLVTKHELVSARQLEEVRSELAELAPGVLVLTPPRADLGSWLEAFVASTPQLGPRSSANEARRHQAHQHHAHEHTAQEPGATHALIARSYALPALVDLERLCDALDELGPAYLRIKGIVQCTDRRTGNDQVHTAAFHRVGRRVSSEVIDHADRSDMVVIGQHIDDAEIAACIAQCALPHVTVRA